MSHQRQAQINLLGGPGAQMSQWAPTDPLPSILWYMLFVTSVTHQVLGMFAPGLHQVCCVLIPFKVLLQGISRLYNFLTIIFYRMSIKITLFSNFFSDYFITSLQARLQKS